MTTRSILEDVKKGKFKIPNDGICYLSERCMKILNEPDKDTDVDELVDLITIGNIIYNNSDTDIMPISDDVYDRLIVKLRRIDYNRVPVGAIPMDIQVTSQPMIDRNQVDETKPFVCMNEKELYFRDNESLFPEISKMVVPYDINYRLEKPFVTKYTYPQYISKRLKNTPHNYPNLVGTLDKCKFVLNKKAVDAGMFNDTNVSILERDFFAPLIERGILDTSQPIDMIGTLKYDGVSIEADVNTEIISARTRGDTDYNVASDLTPIFEGYKFPYAKELDKPIGMKFEAIIMYDDLKRMNELYGTTYANGRTAVIGILGSSDALKYRDFITLVPLQADFGSDVEQPDRLTEIQFLNKYYITKQYLVWQRFTYPYGQLMWMLDKYVSEAEFYRQWSTFMYDGVVLEFVDPNIRKTLGRKNSINQYAMAVKFNPIKRLTTFTGYSYTIGQNGVITPMIHYVPVEFLGSIHTKSTGSSYERFKDLDLFIGDQIEVTYVNDVMPYVSKPDIDFNRQNHLRERTKEEEFPTHCPCCGTKLKISNSKKIKYCPNMECPERTIQRLSNMLSKLGIKDFSQSSIETIGPKSFYQLMSMSPDDFEVLGPTNKIKFYNELQSLKTNPLPDYRIIGALGFSNIASKKWKIIFSSISLREFYNRFQTIDIDSNIQLLANIQGVGPITAQTICTEMEFFRKDIEYIIQNNMYIPSKIGESKDTIQIRFSGFRDETLANVLNRLENVDCDGDAGITKQTSYLLIPYKAFQSTKVDKAMKYGVRIVDVKDFLEHPEKYVPGLTEVY